MIITQVGMAAIDYDGERYTLNPSLAAMAKLRDHASLVDSLLGSDKSDTERTEAAHTILMACCDKDLYPLLVGVVESKPRVRSGVVVGYQNKRHEPPVSSVHAICMASQMVRHGIFGVQPERPDTKPTEDADYTPVFKPEKMAAMAQAHLGVSQQEAWSMTMTSILLALNEKYPPPPEAVARQRLADNYDNLIKRREQHEARKAARRKQK